jgi:hypothetical protein
MREYPREAYSQVKPDLSSGQDGVQVPPGEVIHARLMKEGSYSCSLPGGDFHFPGKPASPADLTGGAAQNLFALGGQT